MNESVQDGVILLDKAPGITSAHAIAQVKRKFSLKKIGHAGTLDPAATGILICLCGAATKKAREFQGGLKRYEGTIQLGIRTSTDDLDGDVYSLSPTPEISREDLKPLEERFLGTIQQIPPQVSAIKKDGKRAYELSRNGQTLELAARTVTISKITLGITEIPAEISYDIICGSGTYIRSIARDLGAILGCGAAIKTLRRTMSAPFAIRDAAPLEQLTIDAMKPLHHFSNVYPENQDKCPL